MAAARRRIVITGASGFVGRQLVPRLARAGCELLLVGRDPAALAAMFPGHAVCALDEIGTRGAGFDTLVHLAVLNNDVRAPLEEFEAVNVGLLRRVCDLCAEAGIAELVNLSSLHVFGPARTSPYARTKRVAWEMLREERRLAVTNLFVPAIYGDGFAGRLSVMNRMPRFARTPLLRLAGAFVPVVHVDRIAEFLIGEPPDCRDVFLSDAGVGNPVYAAGKWAIDGAFAIVVLLFLWWLLLLVWILVRIDSPGPGLFAQQRVGKGGQPFTCYKFRTMRQGTPEAGTHQVDAGAVTPIGRFLRRSKLDELPQAVNILRGELSLVGPRPSLPGQLEVIAERRRRKVLDVTPGITGLAQINHVDMSTPVELAWWDALYVARRTLPLDVAIIFRTLTGHGYGDRVRPKGRP